jgi:hypothetical protein
MLMLAMSSCKNSSQTSDDKSGSSQFPDENESIGLCKDSLIDLKGLNKKIAESFHPLFPEIDTLVLNDIGPLYCAQVGPAGQALDYNPLQEDSTFLFKKLKAMGKTSLLISAMRDFREHNIVKVHLIGSILSSRELYLEEGYENFSRYGQITKLFTYANGRWGYVIKDSSWTEPIYDSLNKLHWLDHGATPK